MKQYYFVRNCFFEPTLVKNSSNIVNQTLKEIEIAFRWDKPAIISSHRVNYIGSLDIQNRVRNAIKLDELIGNILKKWPDVEFMTSVELGVLIEKSEN